VPVEEEWDEDFEDGADDDASLENEPSGRFDLFGDANWPRTRIAIGVVAVLVLLALSIVIVNRRSGAASSPPVASSAVVKESPARPAVTNPAPAPVKENSAAPNTPAPQTRSAVPAQTVRELNAALEAMDSAAASRAAAGSGNPTKKSNQ
jgi:hypothetical protein